jgi:DNA-binding MarR family transcriptional regulator
MSELFPEFDKVVAERIRLGILTELNRNAMLTFVQLRGLLRVGDGNISMHTRKLEEAGFIQITKLWDEEEMRPRTEHRITDKGRQALCVHMDRLRKVIAMVEG